MLLAAGEAIKPLQVAASDQKFSFMQCIVLAIIVCIGK